VGSLTGAVSSERVTEESKGILNMVGNHVKSVKVEGYLTARAIIRADVKAGLSDPVMPCGRVIAQQIKGTPDNRLIASKSSYRRGGLAPRWRLVATR
jgi:hypothetical protein